MGGRLLQQYVVDAWASTEQSELIGFATIRRSSGQIPTIFAYCHQCKVAARINRKRRKPSANTNRLSSPLALRAQIFGAQVLAETDRCGLQKAPHSQSGGRGSCENNRSAFPGSDNLPQVWHSTKLLVPCSSTSAVPTFPLSMQPSMFCVHDSQQLASRRRAARALARRGRAQAARWLVGRVGQGLRNAAQPSSLYPVLHAAPLLTS